MDVESLIREYRAVGEAEFRRRWSTPVLVFCGDRDAEEAASFHTAFTPIHRARASEPPSSEVDLDAATVRVTRIEKRPGGPFEDRIGIGRARNADVHVPLPGLSKYHAYLVPSADGRRYALADAGSKNGTMVEGRRLAPREPVELSEGAEIQLGPYLFEFYTATGLAEMIARRAR